MKEFNETNFERACFTLLILGGLSIIWGFSYAIGLSSERERVAMIQAGLQECQQLGTTTKIWQKDCAVKIVEK